MHRCSNSRLSLLRLFAYMPNISIRTLMYNVYSGIDWQILIGSLLHPCSLASVRQHVLVLSYSLFLAFHAPSDITRSFSLSIATARAFRSVAMCCDMLRYNRILMTAFTRSKGYGTSFFSFFFSVLLNTRVLTTLFFPTLRCCVRRDYAWSRSTRVCVCVCVCVWACPLISHERVRV